MIGQMMKNEWFYSKVGTQHGPTTLEELRVLLQSGQLSRESLVWRQGMGDWTPASAVADLWEKPVVADVAVPAAPSVESAVAPAPAPFVALVPASPSLPVPPTPFMTPQQQAWQMGVVPQSGLAIASLVCGILGILLCYVNALGALPAVICGHMALRRMRESPFPMAGRGMAIAGLIMGYLGLLFQIGMIAFIIVIVSQGASTPTP